MWYYNTHLYLSIIIYYYIYPQSKTTFHILHQGTPLRIMGTHTDVILPVPVSLDSNNISLDWSMSLRIASVNRVLWGSLKNQHLYKADFMFFWIGHRMKEHATKRWSEIQQSIVLEIISLHALLATNDSDSLLWNLDLDTLGALLLTSSCNVPVRGWEPCFRIWKWLALWKPCLSSMLKAPWRQVVSLNQPWPVLTVA